MQLLDFLIVFKEKKTFSRCFLNSSAEESNYFHSTAEAGFENLFSLQPMPWCSRLERLSLQTAVR
jgi:hypothetical protein